MACERSVGDDALLLREFTHRTANEVACALGSLHLLARSKMPDASRSVLTNAIARLEHFGRLHRMLAAPLDRRCDVGAAVTELLENLTTARNGLENCRLLVSAPPIEVDGEIARRMLLVCGEIVVNAIKHALNDRPGVLRVRLRRAGRVLRLEVADDGPAGRAAVEAVGAGLGENLVRQLVARGGGTIAVAAHSRGRTVTVRFPVEIDRAAGIEGVPRASREPDARATLARVERPMDGCGGRAPAPGSDCAGR